MEVKDWLREENQLGIDIFNKKYRFGNETFEQWLDRVSGKNENVKQLILEKKFLFGGRTLSNRGTGKKASFSNCYSSGYVPDEVVGIMELNSNLALTYKAQGGQGLSLSKIRPKGTGVAKGQFTSDGIVPFMELFNQTTTSISQGGARKGALMMSLSCNHKEIETFINIKSDRTKITKANLSVEIDDEFMKAVKKYYDTGEIVIVNYKEEYEGEVIEYSLTPIFIYKQMMQMAYDWAEPGCIYVNRFRNYNLMEHIDEYEIVTGNPCGEQPLPKDGACNLGSLNLSEFVANPYTPQARFNIEEFNKSVAIAVEALDDVLTEGMDLHALQSQRDMARNYRNIGLGIMGLGDMYFKLGIKYGSEKSKEYLDFIMKNMFVNAVKTSHFLAKDRGTFPKYNEKIFESQIIKDHFTEKEIKSLKYYGLRNCSLLSIAPSGSIGTMLDITTGIEPAFQISYTRKTESLHKDKEVKYEVYLSSAKEYLEKNNTDILPDYFITTSDIKWEDRVDIQAIAQNHIDTAISSTVNLPKETTIQEIEKLYLYSWEKGLKGVTIFRDGCKRLGILTNETKTEESSETQELARGVILDTSDDLIGKKRKLMSGCGSLHVLAFFDSISGDLFETYLAKGSAGGCNNFMVGLSRMLSLSARAGVDIKTIVDQLGSSGVCPSYSVRRATKKDTSKGSCCPSAIGNAILEMHNEVLEELGLTESNEVVKINTKINKAKCPECGEVLRFEGGCQNCPNCGWSKCQ